MVYITTPFVNPFDLILLIFQNCMDSGHSLFECWRFIWPLLGWGG